MVTSRVVSLILRQKNWIPVSTPLSSSYNFLTRPTNVGYARYSNQKSITNVDQNESGNTVQTTFADAVKENTKSAGYVGVIIIGVGVTAVIFYAIFRELFSSKSSQGVYKKALERCMEDTKLMDALGQPIKAYGEETGRGRRRHVSHQVYTNNGILHMKMQFYIKGIWKQGTVHLEVQENEAGEFVYRYFFVQLNDFARSVIILEDNRGTPEQPFAPSISSPSWSLG